MVVNLYIYCNVHFLRALKYKISRSKKKKKKLEAQLSDASNYIIMYQYPQRRVVKTNGPAPSFRCDKVLNNSIKQKCEGVGSRNCLHTHKLWCSQLCPK